jgi:hypothetical protein
MRAVMAAALAALGAAALAACNPHLYAESAAPPGRSARLDEVSGFWDVRSYKLELSAGAAIAISCTLGTPCNHMQVSSDAPGIAEVRLASLDVLRGGGYRTAQPAAAFVVVGKAAGTTELHVRSGDHSREIAVTVVPQPAR